MVVCCTMYTRCVTAALGGGGGGDGDGIHKNRFRFATLRYTTTFCFGLHTYVRLLCLVTVTLVESNNPSQFQKYKMWMSKRTKKKLWYDFWSKNPFHTTNCVVCKCSVELHHTVARHIEIWFYFPGPKSSHHNEEWHGRVWMHANTCTLQYCIQQKQKRKMKYLCE